MDTNNDNNNTETIYLTIYSNTLSNNDDTPINTLYSTNSNNTITYRNNVTINNFINHLFNNLLTDSMVEPFTYLYGPLPFPETFIRDYIHNNIEKCYELIENVDEKYINIKEKFILFQYIFSKLSNNHKLVYHRNMLKKLYSKLKLEQLIYNSVYNKNIIKYIFERNDIFRDVLYLRKNWCQEFKENNNSNNWYNFMYYLLVHGNNEQLILFLDWQKFHNKLDWYRKHNDYYFKIVLTSHKYNIVQTLLKYGFRLNLQNRYYFNTNCGLIKYKISIYKNHYIFKFPSLYSTMSYREFLRQYREFFDDNNNSTNNCDQLTTRYLMSENFSNNYFEFNYGDKESCIMWNTSMLYELNYPKKIILIACKNLCIRSDHLDCCNMDFINEECQLLMRKYRFDICIQYYNINKKYKIQNKKNDETLNKMYTRLYINKLIKDNQNDCTICFDKFMKNENIIHLSCNHCYHHECCKKWKKESNICPYCRKFISSYNIIKL